MINGLKLPLVGLALSAFACACGPQSGSSTAGLDVSGARASAEAAKQQVVGQFSVDVAGMGSATYKYVASLLDASTLSFSTEVLSASEAMKGRASADRALTLRKTASGTFADKDVELRLSSSGTSGEVVRYFGQTAIRNTAVTQDDKREVSPEDQKWEEEQYQKYCGQLETSKVSASCEYDAIGRDGKPILDPVTGKPLKNGGAVSYPQGSPQNAAYEKELAEHLAKNPDEARELAEIERMIEAQERAQKN